MGEVNENIQVERQSTMYWIRQIIVVDFENGELGWGQAGSIERYRLCGLEGISQSEGSRFSP